MQKYRDFAKQVNFLNIYKARKAVYSKLKKTNLIRYAGLSALCGTDIYVKHENHNPTGSFKIRGTVNFISNISKSVKKTGVIAATRGNHGLAAAWAAASEGIFCNVVVPEDNNPEINNALKGLGAELIIHGRDFEETLAYTEDLAEQLGYYYIEQGNEPDILNGLGTMGLEIFEDLPDVDTIIVPVGGGGGCASIVTVAKAINPAVNVIAVEPENAPALTQSLKEGKRVITVSADTFADGLAARSLFQTAYLLLKDSISDVVTVTEDEIIEAVKISLTQTHNLAEGAAAAGIACAFKIKERLKGKKAVIIMTGGNLDQRHLMRALS
jgi:threonine dehydratase